MNRYASIPVLAALLVWTTDLHAQQVFYTGHYYPATTYYQPAGYAGAPVGYYRSAPTTTYYASSPTTVYYGSAPTTTYYGSSPTATYYASSPTTVYYGTTPPVNYFRPVNRGVTQAAYYSPPVVYPVSPVYTDYPSVYYAGYPWW